MATASRAKCTDRMRDTCCSAVFPARSAPLPSRRNCCRAALPAAGVSGRWQRANRATTRCLITMARSGRTIRRCVLPVSHATGGRAEVVRIVSDIFETANQFGMRLPELYCGFPRIPGQGPAPYPVACLPQAWSSGAVFLLLQASLGIRIDGRRNEVHIRRPMLPSDIESLCIRDLPFCHGRIGLEFLRNGPKVVVVTAKHVENGVRVLAHL